MPPTNEIQTYGPSAWSGKNPRWYGRFAFDGLTDTYSDGRSPSPLHPLVCGLESVHSYATLKGGKSHDHDRDSASARWWVSRRVSDSPRSPPPLVARDHKAYQLDAECDSQVGCPWAMGSISFGAAIFRVLSTEAHVVLLSLGLFTLALGSFQKTE